MLQLTLASKPYTFKHSMIQEHSVWMLMSPEFMVEHRKCTRGFAIHAKEFTRDQLKSMLQVAIDQNEPLELQQHITHAIKERVSLACNGTLKFSFTDSQLQVVSYFDEDHGVAATVLTTTSHTVKDLDYLKETAIAQKECKSVRHAIQKVIDAIMAARRAKKSQPVRRVK